MAKIRLWTDGTSKPNPGFGGWGVVARKNGRTVEVSGLLGKTTSNRAELIAILNGLTMFTSPGDEVTVVSDSKYSIGVLSGKSEVFKNLDLIRAGKIACQGREITWKHISRERNGRADKVCRRLLETTNG